MTLTEFLLARITEDEDTAALAAETGGGAEWRSTGSSGPAIELVNPDDNAPDNFEVIYGYPNTDQAQHIARWDPARVLAECDAKRKIARAHRLMTDDGLGNPITPVTPQCLQCGYAEKWEQEQYGPTYPCYTAKALALPDAGHPDYQQDWSIK